MPSTPEIPANTRSSVHMDAIRGLAALTVLLGHTRELFFSSITAPGRTSIAAAPSAIEPVTGITIGNEAVIVFFVLSGFLVGGSCIRSIRAKSWSWKQYLVKRLTRLWIVLLPALFCGVAFDRLGLHFFDTPTSIYSGPVSQVLGPAIQGRLSLATIAGNAAFLQTILVRPAGSNNSLWSLANEFWYYLAFPLGLLALQKSKTPFYRILCASAVLAILCFTGKSIALLFPIWMLGAGLSVLPAPIPRRLARPAAAALASLLPVVIVLVRRMQMARYAGEWIVAIFFSLTLYLILHQTERAPASPYSIAAGISSRMSYTLYLFHLPMAVFLCACINSPWRPWAKSPGHVLIYLCLNALLVLAAYFFYTIFEANTDKVRHLLFLPGPKDACVAKSLDHFRSKCFHRRFTRRGFSFRKNHTDSNRPV